MPGTPTLLGSGSAVAGTSLVISGLTMTAGDLVVVGIGMNSGAGEFVTVSSVTSTHNTWSLAQSRQGNLSTYIYYAANAASDTSVTINFSADLGSGPASVGCVAAVAQCSGIATSSPLDSAGQNNGSGSGTTFMLNSKTLAQASEAVFGVAYQSRTSTFSQTGSFSNLFSGNDGNQSAMALSYILTSSTNSVAFTGTWSGTGSTLQLVSPFEAPNTPGVPYVPPMWIQPIIVQ